MNVIGVKWVCKGKYKADNSLDKLKAILVAKGFNQEAVRHILYLLNLQQ